MTAIAKSAKTHPAAKKFCGWEEPAICIPHLMLVMRTICRTADTFNIPPQNMNDNL